MHYKGYLIEPVFNFTNGKSDFQVYEMDADEGSIKPNTTLSEIKQEIDERWDEAFTDEHGCFDHSAYAIAVNHCWNKKVKRYKFIKPLSKIINDFLVIETSQDLAQLKIAADYSIFSITKLKN